MKTYTLRPSSALPEVYLYCQPVDFRRSYRGLAALVEQELGHTPFSGTLYVFINRHRNRIKCLFWEDNGFVLYAQRLALKASCRQRQTAFRLRLRYKALAEEKFRWPRDDQTLLTISGQQLNWLLDGYDLSALRGHKKLVYESLS
jgi:transposase